MSNNNFYVDLWSSSSSSPFISHYLMTLREEVVEPTWKHHGVVGPTWMGQERVEESRRVTTELSWALSCKEMNDVTKKAHYHHQRRNQITKSAWQTSSSPPPKSSSSSSSSSTIVCDDYSGAAPSDEAAFQAKVRSKCKCHQMWNNKPSCSFLVTTLNHTKPH